MKPIPRRTARLAGMLLLCASLSAGAQADAPYYAVEVASASSDKILRPLLGGLAEQEKTARIEFVDGFYRLLVGHWALLADAENALEKMRVDHPTAMLYAIDVGSAQGAASDGSPPPASAPPSRESAPRISAKKPSNDFQETGYRRLEAETVTVTVPEMAELEERGQMQRRERAHLRHLADEDRLWKLLEAQRYEEAARELDSLRSEDPDWQPPESLVALIEGFHRRREIDQALENQQWRRLRELAVRSPQDFSCQRIDLLWGLAQAHAQMEHKAEALATYREIVRHCDPQYLLPTLEKATLHTSPQALRTLLRDAEPRVPQADRGRLDRLRYDTSAAEIGRASQGEDFPAVLEWAEEVGEQITARRDTRIAETVGWSHYNLGDFPSASTWFSRALEWQPSLESAAFGLALTRMHEADFDGAREIAHPFPDSRRLQEVVADVDAAQAKRAYDEANYLQALALLERRRRLQPLDRSQRLLRAWSLYNLGEVAQAQQAFEALHQEQPDTDSRRGLMLALERQHRYDQLAGLIERSPDPPTASEDPTDISGMAAAIAWGFFEQKNPGRAEEWFRRALAQRPGDPDATYGLALASLDLGDPRTAAELARRLPDDPRMREVLVRSLRMEAQRAYDQQDFRRSLELLEESRSHQPLDSSGTVLMGWTLYQLGEYERAATILQPLYDGAPPAAGPAVAPAPAAPPPPPPIGVAAEPVPALPSEPRADHDWPPSIEPAGPAAPTPPLQAFPPPTPTSREPGALDPASIAATLGWSLLEQGEMERAAGWFEQALSHRPDHEQAAVGLVRARLASGDTVGAERVAERFPYSRQIQELAGFGLARRAEASYAAGRYEETLALLEQVARSRPLDRRLLEMRALSLYRLGRFGEAAVEFERLYRLSTGSSLRPPPPPPAQAPPSSPRRVEPWWDERHSQQAPALPRPTSSGGYGSWHGQPTAPPPTPDRRAPRRERRQRASRYPGRSRSIHPPELTPPPRLAELPVGAQEISARGSDGSNPRPAIAERHAALPPLEPVASSAPLAERLEAALVLGWSAYRQQQYPQAGIWFAHALQLDPTSARAARGWIQVQLEIGEPWEAEGLARRYRSDPKVAELLAETLGRRGESTFAQEDYRASLADFDEAATYGPLNRTRSLQRGWALFHLRRFREASEVFELLYREHPDAASAEGLFFSMKDRGEIPGLSRIAREVPGAYSDWLEEQVATVYAQRKLFLASQATAPGQFDELDNITGPVASPALSGHSKSGEPGLGKLEMRQLPVAQGSVRFAEVWQLEARIDRIDLDAGDPRPNAPLGTPPRRQRPFSIEPVTDIDAGLEPHLLLRREGWISPYLELGTTPRDGVLDAALTGRLGFDQQLPLGRWGLELYAQPVRESILSYVGQVDPFSGARWGRVVRHGVATSLFQQWTPRWGSFFRLGAERLRGERVASNDHLFAAVSAGRTTRPPGLDHLSVGPYLLWESYDENLERFTFGHGGYFSPRDLLEGGLAVDLATPEGRRFWLSSRLTLGFNEHTKDQAPFFPFQPDARFYPKEEVSGGVFGIELRGEWRLNEFLSAGTGLVFNDSPRYDHRALLLYLSWNPSPRRGVFSTDTLERLLRFP